MRKKLLSLLLVLSMLLAFMPIMAAADTPITQTTATITKSETDTTYNFNVVAANTYANCYVYAAVYDVNGALLNVNRVPLETTDNTNISVDKSIYNASAKVFIWSDDMQPVIEAEEFTLTPTATLPPRPTATPKPTPTPTATPTPTPKPPSNVTWSLDEATGTLTISGTGDMEDYSSSSPFYNNSNIKSVVIENGVTSIGNYAFGNCSSLTSVTIPDSVTSIDDSAFSGCSNLDSVYITDLAAYLNIDFGSGWSNPMQYANKLYLNNKRVAGAITIPDSVTKIPDYAFYNCDSLTSIIIPNSVTSIGTAAFGNCSSLTSVTIPNSVTIIGDNVFRYCSSLTSVTIPDSVTSIGNYAFYNCYALNSVYITDLAAWCNITFNDFASNPLEYAYCLYLNGELVTTLTIPNGITRIENITINSQIFI